MDIMVYGDYDFQQFRGRESQRLNRELILKADTFMFCLRYLYIELLPLSYGF